MSFLILFALLFIIATLGVFWFTGSVVAKTGINVKTKKARTIRLALSIAFLAVSFVWRLILIILLHLLIVYALVELIAKITKIAFKNINFANKFPVLKTIYRFSVIPFLITAIILGYGFYNMNNVVRTDYTVESNKLKNNYKVVLITDTHYNTIQNPAVLKEKVGEINAINPDVVLLGGDMVEEGTSKAAMEELFNTLGKIKTKYGIYYVYGNHDRQLYSSAANYTSDQLNGAITKNGIKILRDESVKINDDLVLIGREDRGYRKNDYNRLSAEKLLKNVGNEFALVLDHQPNGFSEATKAGADLQLSGHTHAGQIFPLGTVAELFGVMMRYGEYDEGNGKLIVSSGFTGWGFPLRTESSSEYVVVNLKSDKN